MYALLLSIPLAAILIVVGRKIFRALGDAWFEHRLHLRMLAQLERNPDLKDESEQLREALTAGLPEEKMEERRQFKVTGITLVLIGAACVLAGLGMDPYGNWGSGVYIGGIVCIVLGFILTVVSVILQFLERSREAGLDG